MKGEDLVDHDDRDSRERTRPCPHTVDYDPLTKSQLAFTQMTLGPSVVKI